MMVRYYAVATADPHNHCLTAEMEGACLIAKKPRINYVQIQFRK